MQYPKEEIRTTTTTTTTNTALLLRCHLWVDETQSGWWSCRLGCNSRACNNANERVIGRWIGVGGWKCQELWHHRFPANNTSEREKFNASHFPCETLKLSETIILPLHCSTLTPQQQHLLFGRDLSVAAATATVGFSISWVDYCGQFDGGKWKASVKN